MNKTSSLSKKPLGMRGLGWRKRPKRGKQATWMFSGREKRPRLGSHAPGTAAAVLLAGDDAELGLRQRILEDGPRAPLGKGDLCF